MTYIGFTSTETEESIVKRVIERLCPPRVIGGMTFHQSTPVAVCDVLRTYNLASKVPGNRLKIWYGDVETGKAWGDKPSTGYIGRSPGINGTNKVPLLIHNARSRGGDPIMDDCIVRIEHASEAGQRLLYTHPNFHTVTD